LGKNRKGCVVVIKHLVHCVRLFQTLQLLGHRSPPNKVVHRTGILEFGVIEFLKELGVKQLELLERASLVGKDSLRVLLERLWSVVVNSKHFFVSDQLQQGFSRPLLKTILSFKQSVIHTWQVVPNVSAHESFETDACSMGFVSVENWIKFLVVAIFLASKVLFSLQEFFVVIKRLVIFFFIFVKELFVKS